METKGETKSFTKKILPPRPRLPWPEKRGNPVVYVFDPSNNILSKKP